MTRTLLIFALAGCLPLALADGVSAQVQTTPAPPAATPAPPQPRAGVPPGAMPVPGGGGFIRAGSAGGGGATIYAGGPARVPDGGFGMMGGFGFSHSEEDGEMAKLVEAEHELAGQSDTLLNVYGRTEDYSKREDLKRQIRDTLGKQFEVQRQRRELELNRVEERLKKLREQLKKRNDARETIIDRRLETLTSDAEGLGWLSPTGGSPWGGPNQPGGSSFFARPAPAPAAR